MKFVVDRIEENFAVVELEDGRMQNIPLSLVAGCKEGDVFNIVRDAFETDKRKERIKTKLDGLFDN